MKAWKISIWRLTMQVGASTGALIGRVIKVSVRERRLLAVSGTGNVRVDKQFIVARTVRTRLLTIAGRLVNRSGRPTLRIPTNWPWANAFTAALHAIRGLEPATG